MKALCAQCTLCLALPLSAAVSELGAELRYRMSPILPSTALCKGPDQAGCHGKAVCTGREEGTASQRNKRCELALGNTQGCRRRIQESTVSIGEGRKEAERRGEDGREALDCCAGVVSCCSQRCSLRGKWKRPVCISTVQLVLVIPLPFGAMRSQGDLCTFPSASKADLRILETQPIRNDRGEEFKSTPLFVLAGMFFDRKAMRGFSYCFIKTK